MRNEGRVGFTASAAISTTDGTASRRCMSYYSFIPFTCLLCALQKQLTMLK